MKTFIMTIGICLLSLTTLSARKIEKTTLDRLMSTIWKVENLYAEEDLPDGRFCKFDKKTQAFFKMEEGKVIEEIFKTSNPFYLSNNVEETFDESKVGKVVNGKYIIVKYRNIIITEEDGDALRKSLYDMVAGIEPTAKEKRQRKKAYKKQLNSAEIIPLVYQIMSLTANELVLERVSPNMIGSKTIRLHRIET